MRERFNRTGEWAVRTIAHHLPRRLAYWSFIDTGGRYVGVGAGSNDVVPEVTYFEVLERFGHDVDPVR